MDIYEFKTQLKELGCEESINKNLNGDDYFEYTFKNSRFKYTVTFLHHGMGYKTTSLNVEGMESDCYVNNIGSCEEIIKWLKEFIEDDILEIEQKEEDDILEIKQKEIDSFFRKMYRLKKHAKKKKWFDESLEFKIKRYKYKNSITGHWGLIKIKNKSTGQRVLAYSVFDDYLSPHRNPYSVDDIFLKPKLPFDKAPSEILSLIRGNFD